MRYTARRRLDLLARGLTLACTAAVLAPLVLIIGYLMAKGITSLNLDFFTQLPKPVGEAGGGMANAIVGTLVLIGLACVLGLPIGIGTGVFLSEYSHSRLAPLVRFCADVLNGVPSIVIGIYAYSLIVLPTKTFSAYAGGAALGVIMLPIIARTTEEMLRLVPSSLREASLALGVPGWRTTLRVVIRTARGGIITGVMLAVARVAGETAPLLFTAFGNQFWSPGWDQPTSSLPVMIYSYALSPYDEWHRQAWSAGFVLLSLVLVVNVFSRMILARKRHIAR
jgi:phosphate transport system permease protein